MPPPYSKVSPDIIALVQSTGISISDNSPNVTSPATVSTIGTTACSELWYSPILHIFVVCDLVGDVGADGEARRVGKCQATDARPPPACARESPRSSVKRVRGTLRGGVVTPETSPRRSQVTEVFFNWRRYVLGLPLLLLSLLLMMSSLSSHVKPDPRKRISAVCPRL